MSRFTALVPGTPRPQGSQRLITTRDGRQIGLPGATLPEWRNAMVVEFRRVADAESWAPSNGPVEATLRFTFPRPKNHTLKRAAEDLGLKWDGPDLDKLCRAAFDALEVAGVIPNDRCIATLEASKRYSDGSAWPAGLEVVVAEINRGEMPW